MSRFFRGGASFLKPENALKVADELIQVGQKQAALQTLHDIVTSKRHRTWQKVLETVMIKHLDLCVELKKGRVAKDALIHYRNVCQQVNVGSLEEVIKHLLKSATDRAEDAQTKAKAVSIEVEDLEADASPEDLMLSYVSAEKGQDRTDRELVTPWFKFLWETYRNILDTLRNYSRLEALYAMTAARAFQFCLHYKRTTEFRRLCDILRNHLQNLNRYREQRDRPDLALPETHQLYLETRFEQLKVACDLELWQEAFRSVEDVQTVNMMGKRQPNRQMQALYFAKLTRIFTVSQAHLYNGYAWYKLYTLAKGYNRNLTQQDVQMMACSTLLAALAIRPYDATVVGLGEEAQAQDADRRLRMATILGFTVDAKRDVRSALSRGALVSELGAKGVLNLVPAEIKRIHTLLESDFNPLQLCHQLGPLLEQLEGLSKPLSSASPVQESNLGQYVKPIQQVAVLRLLQQLSQAYSSMRVSALAKMVPFMSFSEVELLIVDALKAGFLQVRIDHRSGTVNFGKLQLESDKIRDHIALFAQSLSKSVGLMFPSIKPGFEERKVKIFQQAIASSEVENKRALARKVIIERRKEEQERILLEAEREQEEQRIIQARVTEEAELKRRQQEQLRREEERIRRELEEAEYEEARQLMEASKKKGKNLPKGAKEREKMTKAELMQEALAEQVKERQEQERKLAKLIKQMDHLERARRQEEAPLLDAAYAAQLEQDKVDHAEQQAETLRKHMEAWEADVQIKRRMDRMVPDKEAFQTLIVSRREEEFEQLRRDRQEQIEEKKALKRQEREMARRHEFVRRCRIAVEEKRQKEEEDRLREAEEQQVREEAEKQRRLEEQAAKQAQRMKEIEERQAAGGRAEAVKAAPVLAEPAPPRVAQPSVRGSFVPPHLRGRQDPPTAAPAAAAPLENGLPAAQEDTRPPPRTAAEPDRWARKAAVDPSPADPPKPMQQPAAELASEETPEQPSAAEARPAAAPAKDVWRPGGARRETAAPPAGGRGADAAAPGRYQPRRGGEAPSAFGSMRRGGPEERPGAFQPRREGGESAAFRTSAPRDGPPQDAGGPPRQRSTGGPREAPPPRRTGGW